MTDLDTTQNIVDCPVCGGKIHVELSALLQGQAMPCDSCDNTLRLPKGGVSGNIQTALVQMRERALEGKD